MGGGGGGVYLCVVCGGAACNMESAVVRQAWYGEPGAPVPEVMGMTQPGLINEGQGIGWRGGRHDGGIKV